MLIVVDRLHAEKMSCGNETKITKVKETGCRLTSKIE